MQLESLPNELLIECFKYLNAVDIFHAFDYLNWRFYKLIREISLHLNVTKVKQSKLTEFGIKMLLDPQIKTKIRSLSLTQDNAFDNIQTLLSFLPLDEFSQLQALTLSDLDEPLIRQIISKLPLLTNLRYFCLEDSLIEIDTVLRSLPPSTLQALSIPRIPDNCSRIRAFQSLVHVKISFCNVKQLCAFFCCSPSLKYLNIKTITDAPNTGLDQAQLANDRAFLLKRLVIGRVWARLDVLEVLLQRTPNLKFLVMHAHGDLHLLDAHRWHKLMRDSLPRLDVFKFIFSFGFDIEDDGLVNRLQLFQSNHWHHQYHWCTEYVLKKDIALIYTVPYMLHEYEMTSDDTRYYDQSINNSNVFVNVTDLTLSVGAMTKSDQYHFSSVKSLRLNNDYNVQDLKMEHIPLLRTMVNPCNLTHLEISRKCRWESSPVVLQLLKEASHLSSLKLRKTSLFMIMENSELCEYLNKMIKKLEIHEWNWSTCLNEQKMVKFYETFSNMEEFRCNIDRVETLQVTIDQLSQLPHMKAFSYSMWPPRYGDDWLKEHKSELDLYSFAISSEYYRWEDDTDGHRSYCDSDHSDS